MIEVFNSWSRSGSIPHKFFKFSGGEIQAQLGLIVSSTKLIVIRAHLTSSDDIFDLILTTDAIRRSFKNGSQQPEIHLICPYLPYARQDRVMEPGESLGVKVMCDIINSLRFNSVSVWDAHSDVGLAILDNVTNYPPESFVQMVPCDKANTIMVAPDAGAMKKVFKVSSGLGYPMISASKHRSTGDGNISETTVYSGHVGSKDFLIVDDICDGGRTFTELAKVLRPLTHGKIYLYVTHGIFSRGFEDIAKNIDHVYCALEFPGIENEMLTVLETGWHRDL